MHLFSALALAGCASATESTNATSVCRQTYERGNYGCIVIATVTRTLAF